MDPFGLENITFKQAFRIAKQKLRIPSNVNNPGHALVFDTQYENRIVWTFDGEHSGKSIILHMEDKYGRGPHLHTADSSKGSPLESGRYNQHAAHIPEDMKGVTDVPDKLKKLKYN